MVYIYKEAFLKKKKIQFQKKLTAQGQNKKKKKKKATKP